MHPLLAALALLLDRSWPALDGWRARPLGATYLRTMREQFGTLEPLGALVAVLFLIAVPVAAAGVLLWLARGLGVWVATVFGFVLVVAALGPHGPARLLESYPRALERDDADGASVAAQRLLGAPPPSEPVARSQAVAWVMAQRLHDGACAPALWVVLAGPVGAVLWRAAFELEQALREGPVAQHAEARRALGVLGWLPTRATALALAAMGKSELAFAEWRAVRAQQRTEWRAAPAGVDLRACDELLLARVAEAALRVRPDDEDHGLHLAWSAAALAERAWLAWIAALFAIGALVWVA